ncbi:transposase, partial [Halovibrio variabilis]|uniref:transposase n=1 Tax=Halovibrio variabilis TaxID=31910 RepID=UPI0011BD51DD
GDMYDGFINAVREALPHADIVIDRFHVAKHYNKGVDDLRKATLKTLRQDLPKETYDTFKGSMWAFRRHFWDLTEEQRERLVLLFAYAPDLRQAWLLRHELFLIYQAHYTPEEAAVDFDLWIQKVRASRLTCFDAFIQQLNASRSGILAYFNGRYTSDFVEGLNNRLKVIKRRCFGLLDAGKLFQRIQVDLQERTGCLSLWQNTTSCG